jgi:hypothetical protein
MHHRAIGGLCAAAAGLLAATASLVFAGSARSMPLCNLGQITKIGAPSLSAPSPTYPGATIISTGGSWTSCNQAFTGFYEEWLRDGVIVNGPTFVASSPGSFAYVAQAADVGHSIRSAVLPCNADGCYLAYAQSSNAVVPSAPPPPPPSPPPPMQLTFDEGFVFTVTDGSGTQLSQQAMDSLPDGSYEISQYGGTAGVYSQAAAQPLLDVITGAVGSVSFGVGATKCYDMDKYRTAHDFITRRIVWRFHHRVHWCATYPTIDSSSLRVDSYFSNVDGLFQVDWDDHGTGWWYAWRGSPTGGHYSRRQGKIDNCILRWGCIGSHYPQIEVWVNGNGAWAAK